MTKSLKQSITIVGPTASGKTNLAVALAKEINGEIISIDSRQFYKGMDIGTGKDLHEYGTVPYHLIDIANAGVRLNVSDFKRLFHEAYDDILSRDKTPILCGGTGNYLLSILKPSPYTEIPIDEGLRSVLELKSHEQLIAKINTYQIPSDFNTDTSTKKRCIRIVEILLFIKDNPTHTIESKSPINTQIYGLNPPADIRRQKITHRLHTRLNEGLIDEVVELRKSISDEDLIYYGLEYKYITQLLNKEITESEATKKLETEIHRFAKRQMTFFRKIEKDGFNIDWIDYSLSLDEKIEHIKKGLNS